MEQADMDGAKGRITYAHSMDLLDKADIVIEAVVENADVKKSIFADLDKRLPAIPDPRDQHQLDQHHRDRRGDERPRPRHRDALLLPRAGHEARRGDQRAGDRPEVTARTIALAEAMGKVAPRPTTGRGSSPTAC
jgi:hypothetical protein